MATIWLDSALPNPRSSVLLLVHAIQFNNPTVTFTSVLKSL